MWKSKYYKSYVDKLEDKVVEKDKMIITVDVPDNVKQDRLLAPQELPISNITPNNNLIILQLYVGLYQTSTHEIWREQSV